MGITRTGTGKVGESEEKKEDSIKDQIYNKIFAGIMNNKFSFDEFLTEKSLMEKYQVSRAPVREALMQLRSDRIIASTPRHGYRIRKPAQEELRDIINFRTVMECSFLERYHDMVTKDRIRELRTLCQEYENGGESRSFMEYWKLNREFHETLFMTYKNEVALHYLLESIDPAADILSGNDEKLLHGCGPAFCFTGLSGAGRFPHSLHAASGRY